MRRSEASVTPTGLTMAEASKMIQRAESTIRAWVKTGQVRARQDNAGWWRIERDSLIAHAAAEALKKGGPQRTGAYANPSTPPQQTPLETALMDALNRERSINDELRKLVVKLEEERTQHMAEMRALLSKDIKTTDGVISRWLRR